MPLSESTTYETVQKRRVVHKGAKPSGGGSHFKETITVVTAGSGSTYGEADEGGLEFTAAQLGLRSLRYIERAECPGYVCHVNWDADDATRGKKVKLFWYANHTHTIDVAAGSSGDALKNDGGNLTSTGGENLETNAAAEELGDGGSPFLAEVPSGLDQPGMNGGETLVIHAVGA